MQKGDDACILVCLICYDSSNNDVYQSMFSNIAKTKVSIEAGIVVLKRLLYFYRLFLFDFNTLNYSKIKVCFFNLHCTGMAYDWVKGYKLHAVF